MEKKIEELRSPQTNGVGACLILTALAVGWEYTLFHRKRKNVTFTPGLVCCMPSEVKVATAPFAPVTFHLWEERAMVMLRVTDGEI
jgi:hypothetical protein